MWITNKEPTPELMNLYLEEFVEAAIELINEPLELTCNGITITIVVHPFCGSFDSVARPIATNRLQYNGYYGCSWCYIQGVYQDGTIRYFFLTCDCEHPELRSHEKFVEEGKKAQELNRLTTSKRIKTVMGIKGITVLSDIPFFDCIWGMCFDYMHTLVLGPVRQIWSIWTDKDNRYEPFYLDAEKLAVINGRLMKMTPTHEIHRLPRPFEEGKTPKLKASEWKSWLLYYAYPCLKGVLPDKYLESFMLLSRSTYYLLQKSITRQELEQSKRDLYRFAGECEMYYGKSSVTFNLHGLIHIPEHVARNGSLWSNSTFPFEGAMCYYKEIVTGPTDFDVQIMKRFLRKLIFLYRLSHDNSISESVKNHCQSMFEPRLLQRFKEYQDKGLVLIGHGNSCEDPRPTNQNRCINLRIHDRCIYNGSVLHSILYTRPTRTNDTFVQLQDNSFVQIQAFYSCEDPFFVAYKCTAARVTLNECTTNNNKLHLFQITERSSTPIVLLFSEIRAKIIYLSGSDEHYLCAVIDNGEIQ